MKRAGVSTSVQIVSIVVAFLIGLGVMYAGASSLIGAKTTTITATSTFVSTTTVTGSGGASPTSSSTTSASTATSLVPATVALFNFNYTTYAPWYYGVQHGIFQNLGVDLTITGYSSDSAIATAVASGQAQFGTTDPLTIAQGIAGGAQYKYVSTFMRTLDPAVWLMSDVNSSITTVQQLNGTNVGISGFGSQTDYLAHQVMQKYNITFQEVALGSESNRVTALLSGRVAAVILFSPVSITVQADNQGRIVLDLSKTFASAWNPDGGVIVANSVISNNPTLVTHVLQGLFLSVQAMSTNSSDVSAWFANFAGTPASLSDPVLSGLVATDWSTNGAIDATALTQVISNLYVLAGLKTAPPSTSDIITTQFEPVSV